MATSRKGIRARDEGVAELNPKISLGGNALAETEGFVDSALIHGALATLSLGGGVDLSAWDRQSLLESTYLLLFRKIGIVPGPGGYRGASGPFERVISQLPALQGRKLPTERGVGSTPR